MDEHHLQALRLAKRDGQVDALAAAGLQAEAGRNAGRIRADASDELRVPLHRRAVGDAYGWEADLPEAEVLERLVTLNHARAEEEVRGHVRYLRPAYQNPEGAQQAELGRLEAAPKQVVQEAAKAPWPGTLPERMKAVQEAVTASDRPVSPEEIAARFKRAQRKQVREHLETLEALGLLQRTEDGRYVA